MRSRDTGWVCPRCVAHNYDDERWCFFCKWDSKAPHHEPDERWCHYDPEALEQAYRELLLL